MKKQLADDWETQSNLNDTARDICILSAIDLTGNNCEDDWRNWGCRSRKRTANKSSVLCDGMAKKSHIGVRVVSAPRGRRSLGWPTVSTRREKNERLLCGRKDERPVEGSASDEWTCRDFFFLFFSFCLYTDTLFCLDALMRFATQTTLWSLQWKRLYVLHRDSARNNRIRLFFFLSFFFWKVHLSSVNRTRPELISLLASFPNRKPSLKTANKKTKQKFTFVFYPPREYLYKNQS